MPRKALPAVPEDKGVMSRKTEENLVLKLGSLEKELQELVNQHKMRSTGFIYANLGWDLRLSSSIFILNLYFAVLIEDKSIHYFLRFYQLRVHYNCDDYWNFCIFSFRFIFFQGSFFQMIYNE